MSVVCVRERTALALGAVLLGSAVSGNAQEPAGRAAPAGDSCATTAVVGDLPAGMRVTAGESPVWMLDNGGGRWAGAEAKVSTLWMIRRRSEGDLVVTGRRLDGPERARFQREFQHASDSLVIGAAHRPGVNPRTVAARTMRLYAFHPSYVIYPAPGCWELTARLDTTVVTIVIRQRRP